MDNDRIQVMVVTPQFFDCAGVEQVVQALQNSGLLVDTVDWWAALEKSNRRKIASQQTIALLVFNNRQLPHLPSVIQLLQEREINSFLAENGIM